MTLAFGAVEYLTLADLLALIDDLGVGPVRDLGLLDAAVHRPAAAFSGQEAYLTLEAKAAALLHSLARNHGLVDGNKRVAFLATVVFLRINGLALDLADDQAFALTIAAATGTADVETIAAGLRLTTT